MILITLRLANVKEIIVTTGPDCSSVNHKDKAMPYIINTQKHDVCRAVKFAVGYVLLADKFLAAPADQLGLAGRWDKTTCHR